MIMDKTEYKEKIHDLLSDQSYHPLRKDPTLRLERKINTTLKELEKTGEIDPQLRKMVTPQKCIFYQLSATN